MAKKRTDDVFTSRGIQISPTVRKLQLEFWELRRKEIEIRKALAPARAEYKTLRRKGFTHCPEMEPLKDRILAANEVLSALCNLQGGLNRSVEFIHVKQSGNNLRPMVATMGKPPDDGKDYGITA